MHQKQSQLQCDKDIYLLKGWIPSHWLCFWYLLYSTIAESPGIHFNSCYSTSQTSENKTRAGRQIGPNRKRCMVSVPLYEGLSAVLGIHMGCLFSSCVSGHPHNLPVVDRTWYTLPQPRFLWVSEALLQVQLHTSFLGACFICSQL